MENPNSNLSSKMPLPSFKNPPINEVVCGMRFQVPEKLTIPHIGMLWNKFKNDYPIIQHASPLTSAKGEIPVDNTTNLPIPRVWFINENGDQLIQFQFDRIYFNWRHRDDGYPRYSNLIKRFMQIINILEDFFQEFNLGELKPVEYELSYINHILKEQFSNENLLKIFVDFIWNQSQNRFLPHPEKIAWQMIFTLPDEKGKMTVNLKEATRIADKQPLFVFELRTNGKNESGNISSIREWFDLAHKWIVLGFVDLTTPEVRKKFWGQCDE